MRTIAHIIILALLAMATPAYAQAPQWSWSTDFLSRYVGAANMSAIYDKPVVQTSLTAAFKNGCSVNIWASRSKDRESPRFNGGNEIDWTGSCGGQLGNGFGYVLGVSYFDLSTPILFQSRGDVLQVFGELNKVFIIGNHELTPYVRIEPGYVINHVAAHGLWAYAGVRDVWRLNDNLSIQSSLRVVYDTGIYDLQPGFNVRGDTALAWKLDKQITLRLPVIRGFAPLGKEFTDGRPRQIVLGVGLDVNF